MTNYRKTDINKITLIAILIAVGVIFSYIDKVISQAAFAFLPVAKIGLANIAVLIALYKFSFKDVFVMVIIKSLLVGLISSGATAFIISSSASIVSFFTMYLVYIGLKDKVSMIGVSVIGGFFHIITQLFVVAVLYKIGLTVISYGVILVLISLVTSTLIGLICNKLGNYLNTIS